MIRIICPKCKNAFLGKDDNALSCPACESEFPLGDENLFTGIQYYKEGDFDNADGCLMKYIVQNGAEPRAIFVKALCDASSSDEDTCSLKPMYEKLTEALFEIPDEFFIPFLAMANDEAEKIERDLVEKHMKLFEDADAEKIKKEVTTIIGIRNDAESFRKTLSDIVFDFSQKSGLNISTNFSDCFFVVPESASAVGDAKYEKITANIASHTVFTGSLSTDIKNLEIYYRCIVMFFKKNRDKYDFLMASAERFAELSRLLEEGQYNTIKGTSSIGDKLKSAAYDFFQESLKDHDEDNYGLQQETVLVNEPETIEIPVAEETGDGATDSDGQEEFHDIYSSATEADEKSEPSAEDDVEDVEIISSDSESESSEDDVQSEPESDAESEPEIEPESEAKSESEIESEAKAEDTSEDTEATAEPEPSEVADTDGTTDGTAESAESIPSITATLTKIDKTKVDVIPTDSEVAENGNEDEKSESPDEPVSENENKPTERKHKKQYAPFIAILLIIVAIGLIAAIKVIPPKIRADKYENAVKYEEQGQYDKAAEAFKEIGNYEDSQKRYLDNKYKYASQLEEHKKYAEAKAAYLELGDYLNSAEKVNFCIYSEGVVKLDAGEYDSAKALFDSIPEYKDSADLSCKCLYKKAESLVANHQYSEAVAILETITSYNEGVEDMLLQAQYSYVTENLSSEDETTMRYIANLNLANYKDSASLYEFLVSGTESADVTVDEPDDVTEPTPTGSITIITNADKSDSETSVTEFDSDRAIYIHVVCNDKSLYGTTLSMTYENKYSKATLKKNTFTEDEPAYTFTYSGDGTRNYDITFRLVDADGNVLAEQSVSVN